MITVTEVCRFFGFANFYQQFFKDCVKIANPFYGLILCDNANWKHKLVQWKEACQTAFEKIKDLCYLAPVLAFANFNKPFTLHMDASGIGLGAVLYQELEAKDWVIGFDYLYGNNLTIKSDNNLLTYVLSSAWFEATGHWWVSSLTSYNCNVQYKAGKTNIEEDTLSHINWGNSISVESPQAILNTTMEGMSPLVEICAHSAQAYLSPIKVGKDAKTMSMRDWAEALRADPDINEVIKLYQERHLDIAKLADCESKDLKLCLRQRPKLQLRNLYLKSDLVREDCNDVQLIIPKEYQETALQGCHSDHGHLGLEHMLNLLRDQFYWPTMPDDTEGHIKSCKWCL